jgi:CheY-like chemotaxis protein
MPDRMQRHVLLVDDERAFAEVVAELLLEEGYRVELAHDGAHALHLITTSARVPDLLVCDVMLPGLSGKQVAVEVRRRFPAQRLPIVLLSASADPQIELPDVWFLPKPVDFAELLRLVSVTAR